MIYGAANIITFYVSGLGLVTIDLLLRHEYVSSEAADYLEMIYE
jgi:hypothetical protein